MKDIDKLTQKIFEDQLEVANLAKAMPPKLRYALRRWVEKYSTKSPQTVPKMKEMLTAKFEEKRDLETLAKSSVMVSTFDNGGIRMDFGSNVPEKTRKAAMEWAKKRGLKAVEESMAKSNDGTSTTSVVFNQRVDGATRTSKLILEAE